MRGAPRECPRKGKVRTFGGERFRDKPAIAKRFWLSQPPAHELQRCVRPEKSREQYAELRGGEVQFALQQWSSDR
jgi:hypothetical protein